MTQIMIMTNPKAVASVGAGGPPRVTPSRGRGDTRRKTKLWTNLQRIVEKRGRIGKKVWGDTLDGGDR